MGTELCGFAAVGLGAIAGGLFAGVFVGIRVAAIERRGHMSQKAEDVRGKYVAVTGAASRVEAMRYSSLRLGGQEYPAPT